jgi:TonB family protein
MAKAQNQAASFIPSVKKILVWCSLALLIHGLVHQATAEVNDEVVSDRKVVTRVEPEYPETLKRLYVGGIVRVEAVVTPQGKVESVQLLGGNPILGQSAMKAIKQWKYSPAASREKIVVRLEFDPHR